MVVAQVEGASGGWCSRCGCEHWLPAEEVIDDCRRLMQCLQTEQCLDWLVPVTERDPRLRTEPLFAEGGGKMFGVLACRDAAGCRQLLRAYSGQFNGLWQAPGWVGPICDPAAFDALVAVPDREIKKIGRELANLEAGSAAYRVVKARRKSLSQELMAAIFALYRLRNFRGDEAALTDVFIGQGLPPSGTGDCCAPKLLHHAASYGLIPLALAEFYWGGSNESGSKQHRHFYLACAAKCQPILGFQLCGLPQWTN